MTSINSATVLASSILQQLVNGELSHTSALDWHMAPRIDALRAIVNDDYRSALFERAVDMNADLGVRQLALALLMRWTRNDAKLHEALLSSWRDDQNERMGISFVYRIADYEEIGADTQDELLTFVLNHWDEFCRGARQFYGTGKEGLSMVRSRIKDPAFPAQKKWLYICAAVATSNSLEAEEFLAEIEAQGLMLEMVARLRFTLSGAEMPNA